MRTKRVLTNEQKQGFIVSVSKGGILREKKTSGLNFLENAQTLLF
jgi:hypothetical protein